LSWLTNTLGLPFMIVIESRITHASSSSQEELLRKTAVRGSREERQRSQSVPLTLPASYSFFLLLDECMDWTKLGQQRYRQVSTTPAAPTSAHSRQQITNVEAISGHTAVLPLNWAPTSREQLASRFIVPPPAPQHNPYESAGSYSSPFFAPNIRRTCLRPWHRPRAIG